MLPSLFRIGENLIRLIDDAHDPFRCLAAFRPLVGVVALGKRPVCGLDDRPAGVTRDLEIIVMGSFPVRHGDAPATQSSPELQTVRRAGFVSVRLNGANFLPVTLQLTGGAPLRDRNSNPHRPVSREPPAVLG